MTETKKPRTGPTTWAKGQAATRAAVVRASGRMGRPLRSCAAA